MLKFPMQIVRVFKLKYFNIVWIIFFSLVAFVIWAMNFRLDQTVRAQATMLSNSRVQVIQSVDGGTLSEIAVAEGDVVDPGQILARFDQTRFEAQAQEIQARVSGLKAKKARLAAQLASGPPMFPDELRDQKSLIELEVAIFEQQAARVRDETRVQKEFLDLAVEEKAMVDALLATGDISVSEAMEARRKVIDAEAKLRQIRNEFRENAAKELQETEDSLAQALELLAQRQSVLDASTLRAFVRGQVKNITVSTIGGVVKPGEELMQIIPIGEALFAEAKVKPTDIADIKVGDTATLRFDAFDPSIYGAVEGKVSFISGDTVSEPNSRGSEDKYYIVHVRLPKGQAVTSIGKKLSLVPGMTVQVDIKTGKRTVMQYILKPLNKTLSQSLNEK